MVSTHHPADPPGPGSWHLAVVIPAKNEIATLPNCLAALIRAALHVSAPVRIVVVLDDCHDASADVVAACRTLIAANINRVTIEALTVGLSNVGAARAAGAAHLTGRGSVRRLWLANTDADSCVPEHWLTRQLRYAQAGADAVTGTVTVTDWDDRSRAVIDQAQADYRIRPTPGGHSTGHGHIHAANLGVAAEAYLAAGGFPHLAIHEDVALIQALHAAERGIVWAEDIAVTTSARRHSRTPGGFASYLNALEQRHERTPTTGTDLAPPLPVDVASGAAPPGIDTNRGGRRSSDRQSRLVATPPS